MSSTALALALLGAQLDCDTPLSQHDLNACAGQDYVRADDALNGQWRITLAELRRRDREEGPAASGTTWEARLLAAQRAWIAFRDAHCDSAHHAELALQLENLLNIHCRTQLTEERTRQLADLMGEEP